MSLNIENSSGLKCFCFAYRTKISPTNLSMITSKDKEKEDTEKRTPQKMWMMKSNMTLTIQNRVVCCDDDKKACGIQEENHGSDYVA